MTEITDADREAADHFDLNWYGDLDKDQIAALSKAFAKHREEACRELVEASAAFLAEADAGHVTIETDRKLRNLVAKHGDHQ